MKYKTNTGRSIKGTPTGKPTSKIMGFFKKAVKAGSGMFPKAPTGHKKPKPFRK